MAANTSLSTVQSLSSRASPLKTFEPSLFDRVNWVFGFYVGVLIAGASYCLYNLYQAYQLKSHTAFGLDDRFKLIKCQALLNEAKEKSGENGQPLLQQCESLLASIKDKTHSDDKKKLVKQLTLSYAKSDPNRSYEMAQQLTSSDALFKAAQTIQKHHPHFDLAKLDFLFLRAFTAMPQGQQTSLNSYLDFLRCLDFVKAFHTVDNLALTNQFIRKALDFAESSEKPSSRIGALCQIVQCLHEIEDLQTMRSSLESVEQLLREKIAELPVADQISARLSLANTYFFIGEFRNMDGELQVVMPLIQGLDPLISIKYLYSLAVLFAKIAKNETAASSFNSASMDPLITRAAEALCTPSSEQNASERVWEYLNLASVYGFLDRTAESQPILELAFSYIKSLPETSEAEIKSKIDFLFSFLNYNQDRNVAIEARQILEDFYHQASTDFSAQSRKDILGRRILVLYNKTNLTTEADVFFYNYINGLSKMYKKAFKTINTLATPEAIFLGVYNLELLPEQRKKILETAESFLSQLDAIYYKLALETIMKGYAHVDRQKCFQLLESYENQQAKSYFITAMAIPIIMGVLYHYPQTGIFFSLGFTILSTWKGGL